MQLIKYPMQHEQNQKTHPQLQNDTLGVAGDGSDGPMIHLQILMLLHFDRRLTRTVPGTAAARRWCNALLRLLMNKSHHSAPISLCQPQGLRSGVSSLVERCLFPGPLLINSGYSVWEKKKDEEEGESTGEYILVWLRNTPIEKRQEWKEHLLPQSMKGVEMEPGRPQKEFIQRKACSLTKIIPSRCYLLLFI